MATSAGPIGTLAYRINFMSAFFGAVAAGQDEAAVRLGLKLGQAQSLRTEIQANDARSSRHGSQSTAGR